MFEAVQEMDAKLRNAKYVFWMSSVYVTHLIQNKVGLTLAKAFGDNKHPTKYNWNNDLKSS